MDLWNKKELPMPPIDTYKSTDRSINTKKLYHICEEAYNFFSKEKHMKAEHLVLSRIVYRTSQKFRTAKEFKATQKLCKAVGIFSNGNLAQNFELFIDLIPHSNENYLPNRNLLDYILVKLQGIVKLMERIVEMCKSAALLLQQKLTIGHFWSINFILYSVVSRLYVLARYIANYICEIYNGLYPFSQQLQNSGVPWLPENYKLCKDLKQWLNVEWLNVNEDEQNLNKISEMSHVVHFFDLTEHDDDDIQISDEYILINDQDSNELEIVDSWKRLPKLNMKQNFETLHELRGFSFDDDMGEIIEVPDENFDLNENSEKHIEVECLSEQSEDSEKSIEILDKTVDAMEIVDTSQNDSFNENKDEGEVIKINDSFQNESTDSNDGNERQIIQISIPKKALKKNKKINILINLNEDGTANVSDDDINILNVKQKLDKKKLKKQKKKAKVLKAIQNQKEVDMKIVKEENITKTSKKKVNSQNIEQNKEKLSQQKSKKQKKKEKNMKTVPNTVKDEKTVENVKKKTILNKTADKATVISDDSEQNVKVVPIDQKIIKRRLKRKKFRQALKEKRRNQKILESKMKEKL